MSKWRVPSLVDLCVRSAIDNLQLLGDVGQTDLSLLRKILPHCTADQLQRIETSSGRGLSSITDELWHKFYARKFGPENEKLVTERMRKRGVSFQWRLLYQAKMKEQEEVQKKCVDRLKQLYVKADMKKQSRQIQICTKVPPTSKRRSHDIGCSGPSNGFSNIKGRLMKKAKLEYAASNEARMHAAIRNKPPASKMTLLSSHKKTELLSTQKMPTSSSHGEARKEGSRAATLKGDYPPPTKFTQTPKSGVGHVHRNVAY